MLLYIFGMHAAVGAAKPLPQEKSKNPRYKETVTFFPYYSSSPAFE